MPAPTAYTETQLAAYMSDVLGPVATLLDWDTTTVPGGDYDRAVYRVLRAMGVTAIADVTTAADLEQLETLATREVWRQVMFATAGKYEFTTDGQTFKVQQIHAQAKAAFEMADGECQQYQSTYRVGVDTLSYPHDPYAYVPDEERVLP